MNKKIAMLSVITGLVAILLIACQYATGNKQNNTAGIADSVLIKRGEYLVATMLCDDCHSPKRMTDHGPEIIPELRLSGFQQTNHLPPVDSTEIKKGWTLFNEDFTSAVGAWGASFAGNITSDSTGIGTWTEEQFKKAITQGKFKGLEGSRTLLPPMPWPQLSNLRDEEVKAIYAYLKTTRPVKNVVPAPKTLSELK